MKEWREKADCDLLHRIGRGDADAFHFIFKKYNRQLFATAYNKLRDWDEAKDVVQDVFECIWMKASRIDLKTGNLSAYLHAAVRNRILDGLSRKNYAADFIEASAQAMAYPDESDVRVRERELLAIIDREIAVLPPRMREVFLLSRREHLSHREIADRMQISVQTVTDQVKKALKILKIKLSGLLAWVVFILFF
ncbi:MAG: RNA polymerase sigma-70 factor [Parapedobacter sp.]|nr:MAG: RNA polymerase sigma-70 factor [Parapedobacter sp.]